MGNPIGLLAHIEDYTLRELNLLNEIDGRNQLIAKSEAIVEHFPMPKLKFPTMWENLSNERVLVIEEITHPTLEDHLEAGTLTWPDMLELFRVHGAFMFGWERSTATSTPGMP